MGSVASRDLRNHTREVLNRVGQGETVTITVNGNPVADLHPPTARRRTSMPRSELLGLMNRQQQDSTLEADLAWISEGATDDLGRPE